MLAICGVCGDPHAGHGLAGHGDVRAHQYRPATDDEREKHRRARAWALGVGHGNAPIMLEDGTETTDAVVNVEYLYGRPLRGESPRRVLVTLERPGGSRYRSYTSQVELDKRAASAVR